jgi:predicted aspartyl protease
MPTIPEPTLNTPYTSLVPNRTRKPYIEIVLKSFGTSLEGSRYNALLDTGASCTLIPDRILQEIGGFPNGGRLRRIRGIDDNIQLVPEYAVEIYIDVRRDASPHIIFAREWRTPNNYILLGRDVLDKHGILFDGLGIIDNQPLHCHIWCGRL